MNDLVSDLLARLQNGIARKKEVIEVPNSGNVRDVLEVLKSEDLLLEYKVVDQMIEVSPLYYENGMPVISHFTRVSKPGQRIYISSKDITPFMNGRGVDIISTSQGVMTGAMAKNKNIGGELICKIW